MPAKNLYHNSVKNALIKDGWTITADPYKIEYKDVLVYADLAAEQPIAAERDGQKIAIEIKSFLRASLIREFEAALGQYILYRNLISLTEPERQIYLAIKDNIYENFFRRESISIIVKINQVNLLIVDMEREEITQWINSKIIED